MDASSGSNTLPPFLHRLQKLGELSLVVAGLCYALGFILTNLHLAALGVVNFDLFRVRYVSAGFLFLVFASVVLGLLYVMVRLLRAHEESPTMKRILGDELWNGIVWVFVFSAAIYWFIYVAINSFGSLRFPVDEPPSNGTKLYFLFASNFDQISAFCVIWFGISLPVLVLLFFLRRGRLKHARLWNAPVAQILSSIWVLISILVVAFLIFALVIQMPSNLVRFVVLTLPIYLVLLAFIVSYKILFSKGVLREVLFENVENEPAEAKGLMMVARTVFTSLQFILVPAMLTMYYLLNVYPAVPQQLGGGGTRQVEIITASDEIKPLVMTTTYQLFLIDRTSSDTILIRYGTQQNPTYIQIGNDNIESLTYVTP